MTSFKCLRCSTELSENSTRCPKCGNDLKLSKLSPSEDSMREVLREARARKVRRMFGFQPRREVRNGKLWWNPYRRVRHRVRAARRYMRNSRKLWFWLIVILLIVTIGQGRARNPLEVWQSTRALGNSAIQTVFPDNVLKKNLVDRPKNVELNCPKLAKGKSNSLGIMNSDQSSCEYKADLKWLIDHTTFQGLTNYRVCTQQFDALYGLTKTGSKTASKGKEAANTFCSLNLQADLIGAIA